MAVDDDWGCARRHVEAVGIGDASGCSYKWSVAQVHRLLDAGYQFHVLDPGTNAIGQVGKRFCGCGAPTLGVMVGALVNVGLDGLPECGSPGGCVHPSPLAGCDLSSLVTVGSHRTS